MMIRKLAVIVAHADDAELWVGGTLLNHRNSGDSVAIWYLYCEDEIRRREALQAASILGSTVNFPGSDSELDTQLRAYKPDIIITHWEHDSHPEHTETAFRLRRLLPNLILDAGLRCRVFSCDTYNSVGLELDAAFIATEIIDISEVWKRKCELVSVYKSQPIEYFLNMIERQQRIWGARTGVALAEGFRQFVVLGMAPRHRILL